MKPHEAIDRRSLEMDLAIASRLRQCPELLHGVRQIHARWSLSADASVRPVLDEWKLILDGPFEEILGVLEGTDERSVRLRQSSPFCGILTNGERTRILLENRHDQRAA